ncbi:MAG: DUF4915 domain-containing protein, partial [Planctomycetales bacterium]|nr:DUF4915 domain-containing protein [Planctomycetales bacterium]
MTSIPSDPLRSTYTANFPELLEQLGISLAVTTYQQGKLVLIRSANGQLNTHFRMFTFPMGIASTAPWLA